MKSITSTMIESLKPLLAPRSVAVVGASRDPNSIGHRILEAMLMSHFQGPVYPINPKASVVRCLRCYPSLKSLPEPVDLAVVAVPRDAVLSVMEDGFDAGVKSFVVITAGFAEVSAEGRALQQQMLERLRATGRRMVGPNCLGLLNTSPSVQLNASFSPIFPPMGRVAMSSQSGALGLAILASAASMGLGISQFVSVGNQADVSTNDLLEYWEHDEDTDVILLYVESFGEPRRFARLARRISRGKPIVALKSGRSGSGARAAGSHTAALAASDVAVDALFHQTGIIRAESLQEMFELAITLSRQPMPKGRRVGIITNAGGPAILCADACEAAGLVNPEFNPSTKEILAKVLPRTASVNNPVDMIASAQAPQYRHCVEHVLRSGEVDALIVIYIPIGMSALREVESAIQSGVLAAKDAGIHELPVLTIVMSQPGQSGEGAMTLNDFPCFQYPEAAAKVLGRLVDYASWLAQPVGQFPAQEGLAASRVREFCRQTIHQDGSGWLGALATRDLLSLAGFPLPPGGVARSADEAVALADRVGYPVAIKLVSKQILHKTEVGGVQLHLKNADAVRKAMVAIEQRLRDRDLQAAMEGVIVQPMLSAGVELMVGMTQDKLFGPLIAFGLGGIHVEILKDVCFRVTPLSDVDVQHMIRNIKGFRLLEGYRGHPPADIASLEALLLRLSELVEAVPEMAELDFNPVMAMPPGQGCFIVDARIRLEETANQQG